MSGQQENAKLVTYNALASGQEQNAKLVTYNLLAPGQVNNLKIATYNALAQDDIKVFKLVTYLALSPTPPLPGFGPIPVFPTLPYGFPVNVNIVMDTTIGTTKSLREIRVAQQAYPLWDIEIPFYELLDQTQNQTPYGPFVGFEQYEELVQTWLQMYGQANVFAFDCPWDDSRTDQAIGTGDGSTLTFTVYRTWGSGANATDAPVGLINTVTNVKVNGSVVSSSTYSVGRDTITFSPASAPPAGQAITMTFSYYYLCRFIEDEQDFEEFSKNRWTVPSLKFQAVIWE